MNEFGDEKNIIFYVYKKRWMWELVGQKSRGVIRELVE